LGDEVALLAKSALELFFLVVTLHLAILALGRPQTVQDWAIRSNRQTRIKFVRDFVASRRYRLVIGFVGLLASLFAALAAVSILAELLHR
jgi:hypothetical protein